MPKRIKEIRHYCVLVLGVLLVAFIFMFLLPQSVHAYLDPGTGSYIIQMVIATFLGGTYVIASSWGKIKPFISKLARRLLRRRGTNAT